jgi:Mu transposase, C-terminal domain
VERQVEIVRSHVLAGRCFASLGELDAAFAAWLPHRRAQTHRTHGEVIAVRAERDRAALSPLPAQPYVVCDRHTRRVGKDALISFAASHYSVPWRKVRPPAGSSCGSPHRGGDLLPRWPAAAAGHPPLLAARIAVLPRFANWMEQVGVEFALRTYALQRSLAALVPTGTCQVGRATLKPR